MIAWLFKKVADNRDESSLASRLRRRRHEFFSGLLDSVPRPLTILDLGGTAAFWNALASAGAGVRFILINLLPQAAASERFEAIVGDVRDLSAFGDHSVDVVYSNSVIEHVGDRADQRRMAKEIRRVACRYFIQTPNAHFPVEPHFLVPGFQFMPIGLRAFLLTRFRLGWMPREPKLEDARRAVESVQLLTRADMRSMFPEAKLYEERFCGMTKSITAYHGW